MQNDTTTQRDARIERAVARALEQVAQGNIPCLLRKIDRPHETQELWSVGSRTSGGTIHLIDVTADARGVETRCSCKAGDADRICWHRASVRLAAYGDIDFIDGRTPVNHLAALELTSADIFGHAAD